MDRCLSKEIYNYMPNLFNTRFYTVPFETVLYTRFIGTLSFSSLINVVNKESKFILIIILT